MTSALATIAERVRERVRLDGVDLSADRELHHLVAALPEAACYVGSSRHWDARTSRPFGESVVLP